MMAAIKATLRQYYVPAEDEVIEQYEMDDWMEALEDWPVDEVRGALRGWVIDNPRRRPNYGDVLNILKAKRGRKWASQVRRQPEPQREPRCSAESAARIMGEVGIAVKRFGVAQSSTKLSQTEETR